MPFFGTLIALSLHKTLVVRGYVFTVAAVLKKAAVKVGVEVHDDV